jgi:hypothetical protein
MDSSRLSRGELIAGASAVVLVVALFLPWYGGEVAVPQPGGGDVTASIETGDAWEWFGAIDVILFATALLAVGVVLARLIAALPATAGEGPALAVWIAGSVAVLLIVYRLIDAPANVDVEGAAVTVDISRKIGAFLGLLAAAGIAAGGFVALSESEPPRGEA